MEDPENMKTVLDIIFGQNISLKSAPHSEHEVRTVPDNRQVRLDVYAWDEEENVYDTEAQKEDTKNLPKRSRFYQALLDSNLLEPGSVDFNKLNNVEYSCAAEPPVRGGVSHLSRRNEPL